MECVAFEVRRGWSHYAERKKDGRWALEPLYEAHSPLQHLEVLAAVGGALVGYLSVRDRTSHAFHVHSRGTWVTEALRGCGIATQMWSLALDATKARTVVLYVVSSEGYTLVESLRARFPGVTWRVDLARGDLLDLRRPAEICLT